MNINKEQAIKRLNVIEEETKELRAIIDKKDDWTSITDIESACKWLGEHDPDVVEYELLCNKTLKFSQKTINQKALEICIKAINTTDGRTWSPDFTKRNQAKWYNWFEKTSSCSGSGWLVSYAVGRYYCSSVGSTFYFESEEKAKHGVKYFKSYYDIWLG